jgi:hypothetical protein
MLKIFRDAGIDLGQLPKDGLWKYCRIVIGAGGSRKKVIWTNAQRRSVWNRSPRDNPFEAGPMSRFTFISAAALATAMNFGPTLAQENGEAHAHDVTDVWDPRTLAAE